MPRKLSKSGSCPAGKIRRVSYSRKAHERKSYSKKTSRGKAKIPSAYVSRTYVPSTCVPATGKALSRGAKTPAREKVLPKPGKEISLEHYGYATKKSEDVRRMALRKAAKAHGDLKIERRLVLLSNYQANPEAKRIMKADVKYMSLMHARHMRAEGKKGSSVYERK
jgi:hypothetical protein